LVKEEERRKEEGDMGREGMLAQAGTFCPNKGCSHYGKVGEGNIIRYGKTGQGRQRYQCRECKRVFNERIGTLFYGKRTAAKDIIESLAMVAEGMGIRATARVKGIKHDRLSAWLREAGSQAQQVEAVLLQDYHWSASQIDALWTYVRRKERKRLIG
jgi:transposase-like protein